MIKLYVEGMMCQHCAKRVNKALEAIGCKAEINLDDKSVVINQDGGNTAEAISAAIVNAGYDVKSVENIG